MFWWSMIRLKPLAPQDLELWAEFAQGLRLLPGRTPPARLPKPPPPSPQPVASRPDPPAPTVRPVDVNLPPAWLDKSTWRRFSAGRLPVAAKLDLHGHSAVRAHTAVTQLITRAYAEQTRCVEIITGNGAVLARELPLWLNAAPLRPLILAMAHPHPGNTGAVRILLRRSR